MGVVLFHRGHRAVALPEKGEHYAHLCRRIARAGPVDISDALNHRLLHECDDNWSQTLFDAASLRVAWSACLDQLSKASHLLVKRGRTADPLPKDASSLKSEANSFRDRSLP